MYIYSIQQLNTDNDNQAKGVKANFDAGVDIKLVSDEALKDESVGITLEKTQTTQKTDEARKTDATEDTQKGVKTKAVKSKRTLDEAMSKSYKNWNNMTAEQKQKKIIDHLNSYKKEDFNWLATKDNPDGRVGWLKSFLKNEKMSDDERKVVVGALKQFDVSDKEFAELQAQGVKMVFDKDNLKGEVLQNQVAEDITEYGELAQKVAAKHLSRSEYSSVRINASKKLSKLETSVQTQAVKDFQANYGNISDKVQKQVEGNIVNQYAEFAKENQVDIHKTMMQSQFQEILEKASANVYKFDKTNQQAAAKVTMLSDNEGAIKAMASTLNQFDASNRNSVKTMLNNSQYDSVKTEVKVQDIKKESAPKEQVAEEKTAQKTETEKFKEEFTKATTVEKSKMLNSLDSKNKKTALIQIAKYYPTSILKTILSSEDAISLLAENIPTSLKAKLYDMIGTKDLKTQDELVKVLSKQSNSQIATQKGLLGESLMARVQREKTTGAKQSLFMG